MKVMLAVRRLHPRCRSKRQLSTSVSVSSSIYSKPELFPVETELTDMESSAAFLVNAGAPVTTVTYFKGVTPQDALAAVKERLRKVVSANPWIAGRIVKRKSNKRFLLLHPAPGEPVAEEMMEELLQMDRDVIGLHSALPYAKLTEVVGKSEALAPSIGASYMFRSEAAQESLTTRVTIVSDPTDENACCLIFSMSHVVADGHSYYQVLRQLSETEEIKALNATRKQEYTAKQIEAQGQEDYNFMFHRLVPKSILGLLSQGDTICCLKVDKARMAAAKEAAMKENPHGVRYISSNDVLTSCFGKLTGARLNAMAMSFRGRLEGLEEDDMGNYETSLMSDSEVYARPTDLRHALQSGPPFRLRGQPLPGMWELIQSKVAAGSNWAGFAGSLTIAGVPQGLHLPLLPAKAPLDIMCIFQSRPGELAIFILAKGISREQIVDVMPVGETVAEEIFG